MGAVRMGSQRGPITTGNRRTRKNGSHGVSAVIAGLLLIALGWPGPGIAEAPSAGRNLDVMQRAEELLRRSRELTPWEVLVTRDLRAGAVDRFNDEVATSLDPREREFVQTVNRYRRVLGLMPFEIEERCVVASRGYTGV